MKFKKTLSLSAAVAAIAISASFAPVANAEVSASAGVANLYLFRGFDLGAGDAAVFGDINVSTAGFYAGVWSSSGDAAAGIENDIYVGYGGEAGDFNYDVFVVSYYYPNANAGTVGETDIGDFVEVSLSLGYGPVTFNYVENIEAKAGTYADGFEDYNYYTLSGEFGKFGVLLGRNDFALGDDPTHLDLTYNYNDNLSFTLSKMIADEENVEKDSHFVVSYSIPIE